MNHLGLDALGWDKSSIVIGTLAGWALLALLLIETARLSIAGARRLGSPCLSPVLGKCLLGLSTFLVTEGLSLFRQLSPPGIFVAWSLVAFATVVLRRRLSRRAPSAPLDLMPNSAEVLAPVLAVAVVALGTLVAGFAAPPNNWDAMVYHDARAMQWLDHSSVAHYYTPIDRQLRMPPLASYFKLHLYVLSGSDVLFNAAQWFFFVLSAAECGLATFLLRGDAAAGALATLLAGTLPVAVLQSANSQNNMIAAAYMMSALLVLLTLLRRPQVSRAVWALFGLTLGLGALVKGTDYIVGTVLALVGLVVLARVGRRRDAVVALAGLGLGLALNIPHLGRNNLYFGGTLPHHEIVAPRTWIEAPLATSAKRVVSQLLKNAILQLDVLDRSEVVGPRIDAVLASVHDWMGLSLDDAEISLVAGIDVLRRIHLITGAEVGVLNTDEDLAGNTPHFLLALVLTGTCLLHPRLRRDKVLLGLFGLGWLAWGALSVAIKWMPSNARLELPGLMLLMPPSAAALALLIEGAAARRRLCIALAALLLLATLPYVLFNASKPILRRAGVPSVFDRPRWNNRFRARPTFRRPVEELLASMPASCSRSLPVGLRLEPDQWEYPFWAGAVRVGRVISFRHLRPDEDDRGVCAVITDTCNEGPLCFGSGRNAPGSLRRPPAAGRPLT